MHGQKCVYCSLSDKHITCESFTHFVHKCCKFNMLSPHVNWAIRTWNDPNFRKRLNCFKKTSGDRVEKGKAEAESSFYASQTGSDYSLCMCKHIILKFQVMNIHFEQCSLISTARGCVIFLTRFLMQLI